LKEKSRNISIYYYFIRDKRVNGTLFYCFEYFEFLNRFNNAYFYIYDISEKDLEFVKNIFRKRYNFKDEILEKIIPINSLIGVYNSQSQKNLILDTRTFNKLFPLIKEDIYVFMSGGNNHYDEKKILNMPKSKIKNIYYYGSYEYQNYEIFEYLKFNFEIFKKFKNPKNGKIFTSSRLMKEKKDAKDPNKFFNIFEEYEKFKYIHNLRDVNNRFIPECFFYERELEFVNEIKEIDSAVLRYEDCLNRNLEKYKLTKDDKIIQGILNDN